MEQTPMLSGTSLPPQEETKATKTRTGTWKPGVGRQLPWLSILALVLALLCIVACCVIVIVSDGKPTTSWHASPSVLLALSAAVGNGLMGFAFADGASISWWRKALRGTTLRGLHRQWEAGTSVWAAITSLYSFKPVALGCILVAAVAIDGPLLQRASTITSIRQSTSSALSADIADIVPVGFTALGLNYSSKVSLLTPQFSSILMNFTQRTPIDVASWGCNSTCVGSVQGAGLKPVCTQSLNSTYRVYNSPAPPFGTPFQIYFEWDVGSALSDLNDGFSGVHLVLNTSAANTHPNNTARYSGDDPVPVDADFPNSSYTPPCYGTQLQTSCRLLPAIVDYFFLIENNTLTLTANHRSPQVVQMQNVSLSTDWGKFDYPGISHALQTQFGSQFQTAEGSPDWTVEVNITGSAAQNYLMSMPEYDFTMGWGCAFNFSDPTDDMLANVYELMFRTALGVVKAGGTNSSNSSTRPKSISITQMDNVLVFESHFAYLVGAVAVMAACWLSVMSTFFSWWRLGREMTLSPIEIARSFQAPLLKSRGTYTGSTLDVLLDEVGSTAVRYGEVVDDANPDRLGLGFGPASAVSKLK